jgi:serine/threonine protein kinase
MTMAANDQDYTTGGKYSLQHRRLIGSGGFSRVHEVCFPYQALAHFQLYEIPTQLVCNLIEKAHTGKTFARKLLHISWLTSEELENEMAAIQKISPHVHIVAVLATGRLPASEYYYIDMELCDLDLAGFIHTKSQPDPTKSIPYFVKDYPPPMKSQQIWNVMKQITSGLTHLHSLNLVHRDMKPANSTLPRCVAYNLVLYSRKDSVWKLADFGFTSEADSKSVQVSTDSRGTPGYLSPELIKNSFNNKTDIWSLGCILYELATGERPFLTHHATREWQLEGTPLKIDLDEYFSLQCKETIEKTILAMLQLEPSARPSASVLLNEFLANFNSTQGCDQDAKMIDQMVSANQDPLNRGKRN